MIGRSGNKFAERRLHFLRGFMENPRKVGSVVPSSASLLRKLSRLSCLDQARHVVELGPGTGETTHALLEAMPQTARLMCIELVPEFALRLKTIEDARLFVEQGDALEIESLAANLNFSQVDVVVSGIPFSTLSTAKGRRIIEEIHTVLTPGGSFVAYQFRDRICELAQHFFGEPEKSFVPWNLPPLGLYCWTKAPSGW